MASLLQRTLRKPLVHLYSTTQAAGGCPLTASQPSLHLTLVRFLRRDQGRIEVILNEDIRGLGYNNDIVQVRRGYARNILVPRNRAAYATQDNRKARGLPPLQLQRLPAALRHTTTSADPTTTSATPASTATNHSRRYLQELTAHVGRLPLVFYKEAVEATGHFRGSPIDTLAIYRRLITQHRAFFLHHSDLSMPADIATIGSHPLDVRVRVVEQGAGGVSGERAEVVRVEVRVVRWKEAEEVLRQRRADAAADAEEEALSKGQADGEDADTQPDKQQKGSAKGRERAGVSKMRA